MSETFRLILDGPRSGAENMARDAEALRRVNEGEAGPVLRLYAWDRPTLTLGYAQNEGGINFAVAKRLGVPVVRRPTGGRALLHDTELTYAIALPHSSAHYGSLRAIYQFITCAIESALNECGVACDKRKETKVEREGSSCFSARTPFEIAVEGRKIVASAQRRLRHGALQQGSIIFSHQWRTTEELLVWRSEREKEKVRASFGGITASRPSLSPIQVGEALIAAFERLYDIRFVHERRPRPDE